MPSTWPPTAPATPRWSSPATSSSRSGSAELALRFLRAAAGAGADVLVADPGRAFVPAASLTRLLASYQVPVLTAIEDAPVKSVTVYRLSPEENE